MNNRVPKCVFLVQLKNNIFPVKILNCNIFVAKTPQRKHFCHNLSRNVKNEQDENFQSGFYAARKSHRLCQHGLQTPLDIITRSQEEQGSVDTGLNCSEAERSIGHSLLAISLTPFFSNISLALFLEHFCHLKYPFVWGRGGGISSLSLSRNVFPWFSLIFRKFDQ